MVYMLLSIIYCSSHSNYLSEKEESKNLAFGVDLYLGSNCKNGWIDPKIYKEKIQNVFYIGSMLKEIPDEISLYKNIEKIFIISKNLTKITKEIGKLPKLKDLTFGSFTLNELNDSIKNLLNLRELSIYSEKGIKQLKKEQSGLPIDTLQEEIRTFYFEKGKFVNLEKLEIITKTRSFEYNCAEKINNSSVNQIKYYIGSLPKEIGLLKNLKILNICHQNLNTLPVSIGNLQNLQQINISGNPIQNLPDSLGNLNNLNEFILTDHNLNEMPKALSKLINLKILILKRKYDHEGFANLDGNLDFDFSNLKSLTLLEISGFKICRIHSSILKCKNKGFKIILEADKMLKDDCGDFIGFKTLSKFFL